MDDPRDEFEIDDAPTDRVFLRCANCNLAITDDLDSPYRYCPNCMDEAYDISLVIPFDEWKPF